MDKIICVGKNYVDHAKELGDPVPDRPVLFLKPPSTLLQVASSTASPVVKLVKDKGAVHFETEIVLRIDSSGRSFDAVTLGLDLTLRDLQSTLKKSGHPWEISKVFDCSAIIGPWLPLSSFANYLKVPFSFSLNGTERQKARGEEMIFSPEKALTYAQDHFPVLAGDLLFTGTPAGVGPLLPGQSGRLSWADKLSFEVRFN